MEDKKLTPNGLSDQTDLNTLITWLDLNDSTPKFLATRPLHLSTLREGLHRAAAEIVENLDPDLSAWIEMAGETEYSIHVCKEDMYATRTVEWESLMPEQIDDMGDAAVREYLEDARQEIRWLRNEIGRLKVHTKNAAAMRRCGERESFEFHPWPRRHEEGWR